MSDDNKQRQPQIYLAPSISAKDEFDHLKKIIYLFSYQRKLNDKAVKVLRDKLILLLALYIKYGYTDKAKDKASDILNVDRKNINCMNFELRNSGYLVQDSMNARISHLHDDLKKLKEYLELNNGDATYFLVKIDNE